MATVTRLACNFCWKSQDEVKVLIAAPNVAICDECVAIAAEIVAKHEANGAPAAAPSPS